MQAIILAGLLLSVQVVEPRLVIRLYNMIFLRYREGGGRDIKNFLIGLWAFMDKMMMRALIILL